MNSDRIKEIQQATAYPESRSVHQALLQVWNETAQGMSKEPPMSEGSDEATGYNRANYIKKLIDEIRVDIEKEVVEVDGELYYTQKWINVVLLCDVVSKEL